MNVWIHRYDARIKRYRTEKRELEHPEYVCAKDHSSEQECNARHIADSLKGLPSLRLRNQEVQEIRFDPVTNTVELYLAPRKVRVWKKTHASYAEVCEHQLVRIACPICGKDAKATRKR